ncbi:MAG: hypothetical protein ACYDDO_05400 [Acidiferrobacterales bacterium]
MTLNLFARNCAVLFVIALSACATHAPVAAQTATIMMFTEQEQGGAPYRTRMIVTPRYLRIDNGHSRGGFVLLDRSRHTVYSVSRMDKTILVIKPRRITLARPADFRQRVVKDKQEFHSVDGRKVVHYTLFTNNERCFDVYAAAGLLPDAVAALRDYHQVLAGEQAVTESKTPASFRSDCDLANYVFLPAHYLDFGFPVRQTDSAGTTRQLVDYKIGSPLTPGLFDLPADYRRYSIESMVGGAIP